MKPCQPFSAAGKCKGTADDRHIWPHIANAIRILRPGYVFLENVPGHLSLGFGDVLGDLAEIGYDAQWTSLRASDVGACHRRERVFILGTNTERCRRDRRTQDSRWEKIKRATSTGYSCATPTDADSWGLAQLAELHREPEYGHPSHRDDSFGSRSRWCGYFPAVQRWEHTIGRSAPEPTTTGNTGRTVLNPQFVEWMMGLPAGWVTDVPGISRTGQLHLLGNGVVPQQAAHALAILADQAAAA